MAKVPSRGLDRRHQEGAHRRRRGPQAGHPGRRDPRHQLRPRRGRLPDPGQRRRDPLRRAADPRDRRRRRRGPHGPRRRGPRGGKPRPRPTSRWPSGSASCWPVPRPPPVAEAVAEAVAGRGRCRGRRRGAAVEAVAEAAASRPTPTPSSTVGDRPAPMRSPAPAARTAPAAAATSRTLHDWRTGITMANYHRRRRQEAPRAHRRGHDGLQEGPRRRPTATSTRPSSSCASRAPRTSASAAPSATAAERPRRRRGRRARSSCNCETDFVAKNDDFQALADADRRARPTPARPADVEALLGRRRSTAGTVAEADRGAVGRRIGEKLELRRVAVLDGTGRDLPAPARRGPAARRSACSSAVRRATRPRRRGAAHADRRRCARSTSPATRSRPTSSRTSAASPRRPPRGGQARGGAARRSSRAASTASSRTSCCSSSRRSSTARRPSPQVLDEAGATVTAVRPVRGRRRPDRRHVA